MVFHLSQKQKVSYEDILDVIVCAGSESEARKLASTCAAPLRDNYVDWEGCEEWYESECARIRERDRVFLDPDLTACVDVTDMPARVLLVQYRTKG